MAEEIVLSLRIDGADKAITSIDQLEREVAQLEETMRTADFGSQAFKDAEKELKAANAELYKFDRQLEAIQDPVKAQEKWVKYGEGVAGAFAAAQGAAAIFGVESENVEKMVVKAQGAVSIAMGARMLAESQLLTVISKSSIAQKALSAATAVYTAVVGGSTGALKLLRIALVSTGVGAIAVAVGMLVANWGKWSGWIKDTFEKVKKFLPGLEKLQKAFNFLKKKVMDAGEALGVVASEAERAAKAAREAALETLDVVDKELQREIELLEARGKDATESRRKWLNRRVELLKEALDTEDEESVLAYEEAKHKLEVFEANQTRIQEEAYQRRWERRQKAFKEHAENMERLAEEIAKDMADDEGGMLSDFLFGKDEEKAKEAARQRALERIQFLRDLDEIIEEDEEEEEDDSAMLDSIASSLGREHELRIQFIRAGHSAEEAAEMAHNQAMQEQREQRINALNVGLQTGEAVIGSISALSDAFAKDGKKNAKLQKTLAVAQIAIDTAKGIAGAVAAGAGVPFPGNIPAIVSGVTAVLTNIAAAKKALSQAGEGGDDGGGTPGVPTISAPTFSAPTATGGGEAGGAEAAEEAFQTAGRAYVLDSDVSSGLEAQQRINDLASL